MTVSATQEASDAATSAARVLPCGARGLRGRLPGGLVDPHQGSEAGDHREARTRRGRHRLGPGADRALDHAHQPAHGAPARASEGPLLPARAAEARRPPAPLPELPTAERPGGLSGADQGTGPEAIEDRRPEGGSLSESRRPTWLTQTSTFHEEWRNTWQ